MNSLKKIISVEADSSLLTLKDVMTCNPSYVLPSCTLESALSMMLKGKYVKNYISFMYINL